MKITQVEALHNIHEAETTEYLMYCSGAISPIDHLRLCDALQYMCRLISKSMLSEFEGED